MNAFAAANGLPAEHTQTLFEKAREYVVEAQKAEAAKAAVPDEAAKQFVAQIGSAVAREAEALAAKHGGSAAAKQALSLAVARHLASAA